MARTGLQRRGRATSIAIKAAVAVVIVAVCAFGTTFMTPEEAEAVLTSGATDPVAYAEEHYDSTIAYVEDNAIELTDLIADLQADEEGTCQERGHRDG